MKASAGACRRLPALARLGAALLLIGFALWPSSASAWWDNKWSSRAKVTLDAGPAGAAITDPIGRVAVLLRLHSGNFDFAGAKEDGADLRFVAADDKTPLKYQIEKFDPLIEQVGLVWVDVPNLTPGASTSIWLYWGNADAAPGADAPAVWDAEQLLVYHFGEADGVPRDSTRNGNDALGPGERDDGGLIGPGLIFRGGGPVRLPASTSLAIAAGQPLTWSAWVRMPGAGTGVLYSVGDARAAFSVGFDRGMPYVEVLSPTSAPAPAAATPSPAVTPAPGSTAPAVLRTPAGAEPAADTWHHLAVTAGEKIALWVDGTLYGEVAGSLPPITGEAMLGGRAAAPMPAGAPGNAFMGQIDELRIARTVRAAGWLQAEVRSQGPDARLVVFDVAETSEGGSGYLPVLLNSLTIDGWIIIALCGIMAVVCVFVMVGKAIYIGRLGSANRVFRDEFAKTPGAVGSHVGAAATGLSEERSPGLARSTLYALYKVGLAEVAQRVDGVAGNGARTLGAENLVAIRAALDSEFLRQTQRMNAQMVMLTIAISGGPFLGLLGTVVGVMITFAAVAAAGDVNINAIAPGIAAALLATVAGLGVAIPSLFGYNWLLTRIKEQSAQMQLFVNELTARIAEAYSATSAAKHGG